MRLDAFVLSRSLSWASLVALLFLLAAPARAATYTDNGDGTVTDPTTGLTWMRCAMGQTWTGSTCSGTASSYTWDQAVALTATVSFAGHSSWRLPNIRELQSIVDRSAHGPAITATIFPKVSPTSFFWSASANAYPYLSSYAWYVYFGDGHASYVNRSLASQVRLVRAGQSLGLLDLARPTSDYVDHGDGTVTHTPTGLTWKRCAEGQNWSGTGCSGTERRDFDWGAANLLTSTFAGKNDWRLPAVEELLALVDYTTRAGPSINTTVFPNSAASNFWSASASASGTNDVWSVNFVDGSATGNDGRFYTRPARLVRAGQSLGTFGLGVGKTGAGTVSSNVGGINCGSTCTANYTSGTTVVLTATPDFGPSFSGWSGACSGTGTCTLTMDAGKSVTATFSVSVLNSIAISCPSSVNEGTSASSPCTATATYSDGSTRSATPTWSSSNPTVAVISSSGTIGAGQVTANTPVTITASYTEGGVTKTASASVTVTDVSGVATLSSLAISGGATQLSSGASFTLTATANYSDGSSKIVSPAWTSNSAAVTVAPSVGTAAGTVSGNAVSVDTPVTITATYFEAGVTRTAIFNVTVKAAALAVSLSTLSIGAGSSVLAAGASMTLSASAGYTDGTSRTVDVSWSSSSAAASVSSSGQVTAAQVTSNTPVTITASYTEGGITRTASLGLTVTASTAARLGSISIQGSTSVPEGGTTTLKVIAAYSDGSTKSVAANWSSSNASLVSVAATGALTVGQVNADTQVTLTASFTEDGVTVTSAYLLTVKDVANALSYLIVEGASSLREGQTTTLTARAYYTDGSSNVVTPTWTSSNSAVAAVSAAGMVTAGQVTADASVTLTATYSEAGITKTRLFPLVVTDIAAIVISTAPALASGYSHTIALRNDGSVWSWGWSSLGQSGSGATQTRSVPVKVAGIDSITGISAGAAHNLALKADGTVWAWGHNASGGLGDGSTDDRQTPIQVTGVNGVKALAAGLYHSLALKADGTVVAWGSNSNGQLADTTGAPIRPTPSPIDGLTGVTAIAASYNASLALKSNGTILAWGDLGASGNLYAPVPIGQISDVQSLAAGWFHWLALKTDGTVWAWGSNAQGQLGDGTTTNRAAPVQLKDLADVKAIAAGFNHSVAITNDGRLWTWGGNAHGQLGSSTSNSQPIPQTVTDVSGAIAVAAGNEYTIVLKSDGSVWGAGDNWLGQLGDGSFVTSGRFAPVQDADQAKLFDLALNQVKAPVPADQVPVFYMKSEKSGDEVLTALGSVSSMSLVSKIPTSGNGFSATYQMFVAISVPGGRPALTPGGTPGDAVRSDTLFFKIEQTGWQPYGGGVVPAYLNDVNVSGVGEIALSILESTDLTGMSGAQFLVGFGTSASEMLNAGRYRVMYRVP